MKKILITLPLVMLTAGCLTQREADFVVGAGTGYIIHDILKD